MLKWGEGEACWSFVYMCTLHSTLGILIKDARGILSVSVWSVFCDGSVQPSNCLAVNNDNATESPHTLILFKLLTYVLSKALLIVAISSLHYIILYRRDIK